MSILLGMRIKLVRRDLSLLLQVEPDKSLLSLDLFLLVLQKLLPLLKELELDLHLMLLLLQHGFDPATTFLLLLFLLFALILLLRVMIVVGMTNGIKIDPRADGTDTHVLLLHLDHLAFLRKCMLTLLECHQLCCRRGRGKGRDRRWAWRDCWGR